MNIRDLKDEAHRVINEQRELNDKVLAEEREYTAEETAQWEKLDAVVEELKGKIEETKKADEERKRKAVALADAERHFEAIEEPAPQIPEPRAHPDREPVGQRVAFNATEEYEKAYTRFLLAGANGLREDDRRILTPGWGTRNLQADSDVAGGFLLAPEKFQAELIKDRDNMVFVRRYARKFMLTDTGSMVAPARQDRMGDPTWTSELLTGAEDTALDFDRRRLTPHPLARRIRVSNTLLRLSAIGVDAIIRDEFGYEFSTVEENAFLNGTGAGQPLGIFTAIAGGISTGRDVSTANTTTAIKADNLIECLYSQPAQYRTDARWIFHRDALKMIRKLKDGEGNYLWQPGLASDRPATILSVPYDESEYCPNTFSSGKYVGALCSWSYYWIVDALTLGIQVLRELYAETNQTGYIARSETDAMPIHENGFVRVTLA
jgi:HK97 family phage major capsid protein